MADPKQVIFLLSVKAGLRAKEIARLTWRMVTDARGQIGQAIHLEDTASKGRSGRVVPINDELRAALVAYAPTSVIVSDRFLIESERSRQDVRTGHREPVLAMVSMRGLRRVFEP